MPLIGGPRVEAFLRWADELAERAEPSHQLFSEAGEPSILAVTYLDGPSPGWTRGATSGASLLSPSNVEFVTPVQSRSPLWTWAVADFIDRHRAEVGDPRAGDAVNWGESIAPVSAMDALVIVEPRPLDPGARVVHLTDDDHVHLLQAIPVHASELRLVRELGADVFLDQLGVAAFDPRRTPRLE